jgi:anti-anti-sigma factor
MGNMEFKADVVSEVTVIQISGRLDNQTSLDAQKLLVQNIDNGAKKILIDFKNLDYISSSGLSLLIVAAKRLTSVSGQLRVCNLNNVVREVFEISGFTAIVPVSDSQAAALNEF